MHPLDETDFDGPAPAAVPPAGRRGSVRSRFGRLLLAACLIALGAGGAALLVHGSEKKVAPAPKVSLGTTTVTRGDLITVSHYHGKLVYPSRGTAALAGSGTVTSLPHRGQILTEGGAVAGVDDRAVGVLFGRTALYRTLGTVDPSKDELAAQSARANLLSAEATLTQAKSPADIAQAQVGVARARATLAAAQQTLADAHVPESGPDVALVAADMTALGYLRGVTDVWSATLQDAVRAWQEHIGAAATGQIDPGDVVVVPGPARVSSVKGGVGDATSSVTISLSAPSPEAAFHFKGEAPGALTRGRRVRVSARGQTSAGHVVSVKKTHGSAASGDQPSATVTVAFDRSSALAGLTAGRTRVAMSVTTSDRRQVLTVSTQALLALASGGYALQLPDGHLIAVHTGAVHGTKIEVSGSGIHPGLQVVSVT